MPLPTLSHSLFSSVYSRVLIYISMFLILGGSAVGAIEIGTIQNDMNEGIIGGAAAGNSVSITATVVAAPPTPHLRLLFIGDMMFDRAVRKTIASKGYSYVFGDSKKIFSGYDIVVGNLEGSITNFKTHTVRPDGTTNDTPLDFTFATGTANALHDVGVDIVSLANNHTNNRGASGLKQTRGYLKDADVSFFGDPNNAELVSTTTCQQYICVGIIGYHEFAHANEKNIITAIQELRQHNDVVIVMPHWGIEYQHTPTTFQRNRAHEWIDVGADVVIGAHPHVIESIETYKGHSIFYSLGNYIFDQTFSFDTTHAMTVGVNIEKSTPTGTTTSISYTLTPVQNTNITISLPDASTTAYILQNLSTYSAPYVSSSTTTDIIQGKI